MLTKLNEAVENFFQLTGKDFNYEEIQKIFDFDGKDENEYGNLWLYEDEQKLNPQYILTDKIKKLLKVDENSKPRLNKFIDYFAKKDLKGLIGFDRDIKYKQLIYEDTKNGTVHLVQPF